MSCNLAGSSDAEHKVLGEKSSVILNSLQDNMRDMICFPSLLPHLLHRELITEIERNKLTDPSVKLDSKLLSLSTCVCNKGKTGLARFYLCLMDTYGLQGVKQHYDVAILLRKLSELQLAGLRGCGHILCSFPHAALDTLGFNAEDVYRQETGIARHYTALRLHFFRYREHYQDDASQQVPVS